VLGLSKSPITTVAQGSKTDLFAPRASLSPVFVRGFAAPGPIKGNVGDIIPFPLADIGEGIAEVEILKWFIKPGDTIHQFDKVCEVQSDKATVEITSRYDGVVQELMYEVGKLAPVGKPLFTIKLTTPTAAAMAEGQKASAAAAAPAAAATPAASCAASSSGADSPILAQPRSNDNVLASPVVRRIARELNIDLGRVRPTGHKGQITKEDLYAYQAAIGGGAAPVAAAATPAAAKPAAPDAPAPAPAETSATFAIPTRGTAAAAEDKTVECSGIQRIMVKTMTAAASVPTFGYADEVHVDNLIRLRKKVLPIAQKHGVKLSYFAFILKAMSLALSKYPILNSHVNNDCSAYTIKGSHNIGIAMDTPRGLLVLNIKNVQNLSVLEIAAELARLQELGKQGKLGQADLQGGTITLSNIGTIGGTYCRPVLVVPEVCIGALGKFTQTATFDSKGNVQPATVMHIAWTADHRILDGATVARFANEMKELIENPESLILY